MSKENYQLEAMKTQCKAMSQELVKANDHIAILYERIRIKNEQLLYLETMLLHTGVPHDVKESIRANKLIRDEE